MFSVDLCFLKPCRAFGGQLWLVVVSRGQSSLTCSQLVIGYSGTSDEEVSNSGQPNFRVNSFRVMVS